MQALAKALAAAQLEIEGAAKSSVNPHFKSKYADLSEVSAACRPALNKHGIAVVQMPSAEGPVVSMRTMFLHESGESIESVLSMTAAQNTPQAIGSVITYLRRYALASMAGVAPEDDDANAATERPTAKAVVQEPAGFAEWLLDLEACAVTGTETLQSAWRESRADLRQHLTASYPEKWTAIKARAAKAAGAAA